jgi:hypothetical protein
MTARAGSHWSDCQEAIGALRGIGPDDDAAQACFATELDRFGADVRHNYPTPASDQSAVADLITNIVDFIGRDRLLAAHPAYAQGGWLEKVLVAATLHLHASSTAAKTWTEALDTYEGARAVPLMTIHKSNA